MGQNCLSTISDATLAIFFDSQILRYIMTR